MQDKSTRSKLRLCLVTPIHHGGRESCRAILRLLEAEKESVDVLRVGLPVDGGLGDFQAVTLSSLAELRSLESQGNWVTDLFLCWDLPVLYEILALGWLQPIVYGLTLENILQACLPVHPAIVGYASDVPFHRAILNSCGVSPERQFGLCIDLEEVGCSSRQVAPSQQRDGILIVGDSLRLVSALKAACGLLGLRLDRLPVAAAAEGIPPEFFTGYECIVASGRTAIRAAAAGVAVIVADERGCAGLLTRQNLKFVLEARAEATCFDAPVSTEVILTALNECRTSNPADVAKELFNGYSRITQAARWSDWLRKVASNWERGYGYEKNTIFGQRVAPAQPQLLSIVAMARMTSWQELLNPWPVKASAEKASLPSVEVLINQGTYIAMPLHGPRLPLNSEISASDVALSAGFFGDGWSFGEPWGRWTEGHKAVLNFDFDAVEGDLELLFTVQTFLPPGRLYQRVAVSVNGRFVVCWKVGPLSVKDPYTVPLCRDFWEDGDGRCEVAFFLPDADSPFAWGRGDRRKLGLGLTKLRIVGKLELPPAACQPANSHSEPAG